MGMLCNLLFCTQERYIRLEMLETSESTDMTKAAELMKGFAVSTVYVCVCMCLSVCMDVCWCVCMGVCVCACVWVCVCVSAYVMCVYGCVLVCVCVCLSFTGAISLCVHVIFHLRTRFLLPACLQTKPRVQRLRVGIPHAKRTLCKFSYLAPIKCVPKESYQCSLVTVTLMEP